MRGCTEHTDKEHRNSNHAHRMCVLQMSLLTHSSFVRSLAVQLSQILPFSPSTPLPSLSFFLFSFILSLPRSASPKTHRLLATKAFSSKNKWPSHDGQDKIWFNYRNLPKEFRVWAQIQRAAARGCDVSQAAWPEETCSYRAVTLRPSPRPVCTRGARFHIPWRSIWH